MSNNSISSKELDEILSQIESSRSAEIVEQNNAVTFGDYERREKELTLKLKDEQLQGQKQDREQRRQFAEKIFWVVVAYLAAVIIIVILNGFKVLCTSDPVHITLLGTTTANVITLLVIVAKYLFHAKE